MGFAVWAIYLADRLLDGRGADGKHLLERHHFSRRHRVSVGGLAAAGAIAGGWLACTSLNIADLKAGLVLAISVGAYFLCVHSGGAAVSRLFPKEFAVGVLFAAGTALPVWAQPSAFSWDALDSWLLFATVCMLNCLAIECWESEAAGEATEPGRSPVISWVDSRIAIIAASAATLAFTCASLLRHDAAANASCGAAAFLILLLDLARVRLSRPALRVLADAALLAPALIALFIR